MKRTAAILTVCLLLAFSIGMTSAGGLWVGHPTTIESPFHRAWHHHQWCGAPTSKITYGYYGAAHQTFRHCTMTFSRVFVAKRGMPTVTPRPTHTPPPTTLAPPTATKIPTPSDLPTATPVPATPTAVPTSTPWIIFVPVPTNTALPPTPLPIPTVAPSTDPVAFELSLLNTTRAQFGAAPLSLNSTQSNGTATCVGSLGHSQAMAQSGQIWHINASYPAASFPNNICVFGNPEGENVGAGTVFGDPRPMLQQLHNSMMAEGASNCATVINHACNIINPAFHQVGIGILVQNGSVWLTTDFLG